MDEVTYLNLVNDLVKTCIHENIAASIASTVIFVSSRELPPLTSRHGESSPEEGANSVKEQDFDWRGACRGQKGIEVTAAENFELWFLPGECEGQAISPPHGHVPAHSFGVTYDVLPSENGMGRWQ